MDIDGYNNIIYTYELIMVILMRFESECYGEHYYTEIIDNEKKLDLNCDNPSKQLTITEIIDMLNNYEIIATFLRKQQSCHTCSRCMGDEVKVCFSHSLKKPIYIDEAKKELKKRGLFFQGVCLQYKKWG